MKVLTRTDAARDAGLSLRTLERAIERGEGPPIIRLSERRVGILAEDFAAWLLARRVGGAAAVVGDAPPRRGPGRPRKVHIATAD